MKNNINSILQGQRIFLEGTGFFKEFFEPYNQELLEEQTANDVDQDEMEDFGDYVSDKIDSGEQLNDREADFAIDYIK